MASIAATEPFSVRSDRLDGVCRVTVRGELDLATTPAFINALESPEVTAAPRVVLDLQGVTFIDSRGIAALVRAGSTFRESGRELRLTPVTGQVKRVLEYTDLLDRFEYL